MKRFGAAVALLALGQCTPRQPAQTVAAADSAELPFAEFDRQAQHLQCALIQRCGLGPTYDDLAHCDAAPFEGVVTSGWGLNRGMGIDASYQPKFGKACLAELAKATEQGCDYPVDTNLRRLGAACAQVFAGALPNGAACRRDPECQSGACVASCPSVNKVCAPTVGLGARCKVGLCGAGMQCERGVCVVAAPPGLNDSCDERHCPETLACVAGPAGGTCVPKAGFGQACTGFAPRGVTLPTCQPDLVCAEQSSTGSGVCAKAASAGEPCDNYGGCPPGLECSPAKTCLAPRKVGDTCTGESGCGRADLHCQAGKCAVLPAVGQPCAAAGNDRQLRCLQGSYCDPTTTTCKAFGAIGQPCAVNTECPLPLQCAGGTCRGLGGVGEPCNPWCVEGLKCKGGVCVALRGVGDPCDWHEDCAVGLYCQKGTCVRQAAAGAACESWWACGAGTDCSGGVCSAKGCGE